MRFTLRPCRAQDFCRTGFIFFLILFAHRAFSQPSYTADDKVADFNVPFGYGVNPGYYGDISGGSGFDRENLPYDVAIGQLAAKVGINTWRPMLPAYVFLQYGNSTDLRQNDFNFRINEYTEIEKMGIRNDVVFIGDATDHQDGANVPSLTGSQYRNLVKYEGCDKYSYEFKNMYEPIWDNGENGTPVNENNYYALYVYKLVRKYKKFIKVYEVVNEIDFLGAGTVFPDAKKGSNKGNNWFDRNPTPCELLNWRAPVFSYVRMLRITYEVVKTVDPSAFVALGGIGYESFLDVVLRNTDNPVDGSVNTKKNFPRKGGAYFDVLSYHMYPQYDLRKKDANGDNIYPFIPQRHSDEASERSVRKKDDFQRVLTRYQYDGIVHPKKHFIITEINIPRRTYPDEQWIGSNEAQRNFLVKTMVKAQQEKILQVHIFKLGESSDINDASGKEGHEGLYENLLKAKRTTAVKTPAGIAIETMAALLDNLLYDERQTKALSLPAAVDGAAFKTSDGRYVYVLWAKTTKDNSEIASAMFTFPAALKISKVISADWDFARTEQKKIISGLGIKLTASPSFFTSASDSVSFNKLPGIYSRK